MEKKYHVEGMSCDGCRKKISESLNNIPGISATVNLNDHTAEISSEGNIDLGTLNNILKKAGNYHLTDPQMPADRTSAKPQDHVSPSSVYYCPMECEGDKVYFQQGKRCPVCNMYLVPIEEKTSHQKTPPFSKKDLPPGFKHQTGKYFCPMFCEGDKVYDKPGDCPVCHMHLEKITPQLIEDAPHSGMSEMHHHTMKMDMKSGTKTDGQSHQEMMNHNAGKYYCPMYCEGDKVYDSNVGCPVCGMDLVKIPEKKTTLWTCPMHPEIVEDHPGSCPICGMDLVPMASKEGTHDDDTYRILRRKFLTALIFTVPVLILSMGGMWIKWPFSEKTGGWIQFVLSLPVIFYAGWFLLKRGWTSFKTWNLNMFSLIALGAAAAFIFSLISLTSPNILPHEFVHDGKIPLYFESVCVILTLVIMGQMLEAKAHQKTGKAIEELMNLSPDTANLIIDGKEKKVPLSDVKVGDLLRVKAGEKIPVDGKITEGSSSVDESSITGEPLPAEKNPEDTVTSGTINKNGSFVMKAEKVGDETLLSHIIRMVNEASRSKAPIQKLADRISGIFVPVVIGISILTFIAWYFFGGENRMIYAFVNAVAVLIVACPCALGLATPMSMTVGIGIGAKNGILIRNADALELMHKANVLITDKTGTLTEGKPSLEKIITAKGADENTILQLAASLNQNSDHPLSEALLKVFNEKKKEFLKTSQFENISGKGIQAVIDGKKTLLGNAALLESHHIDIPDTIQKQSDEMQLQARTVSYLAQDGKILGFLTYHDKIKETSKKAVAYLQAHHIEVIMMTGDNEHTAKAVATELGIGHYVAGCMPEDKMKEIKKLQQEGKTVAMSGDGINDAPALAQANIGIAMGTGSDAAIESAEITLVKGDLMGIVRARILSEKLLKNIKENLFFAFVYNTLGIPVAAGLLYPFFGILLSPMIAAAAMSFSSVSVILNSLRLNNAKIDIES